MHAENIIISVIRGNNTYLLDDYAKVYGIYGLGPANLRRLITRGPLQHGDTDRGFRLEARTIRLMMYFMETDDYWGRRNDLVEIFAPTVSDLVLRFDLANGNRRHINAHALGFPMNTNPSEPGYQKINVDLRCADPSFFDPVTKSVSFAVSYGSNSMQVPLGIPWMVGSSLLDQTKTINYTGSWKSYPHLIRIYGQITSPVITNLATGEKLDFTGVTIADGDYYDIDLRYSYKTVKDKTGVNKIADLTTDSDLSSWHLAAMPEISDGNNAIHATGTSINSNTEILIQYYDRFSGV